MQCVRYCNYCVLTLACSQNELIVWLSANLTTNDISCVRIVTNKTRSRDGGSDAARRLVNTLRKEPITSRLRILIYCHDTSGVLDLGDKYTTVSNDPQIMSAYCSFKQLA